MTVFVWVLFQSGLVYYTVYYVVYYQICVALVSRYYYYGKKSVY